MSTTPNTHLPWRYPLALIAIALSGFLLFAASTSARTGPGSAQEIIKPAPPPATVSPCPPSWNARAPYPIPITDNAVTSQGSFLYSFSGRTTNFAGTGNAYRYDPIADKWTQLASIPEIRIGASAVSDGKYVYILNGMNVSGQVTNTVFRYDPASNGYSNLPPLAIPTAAQAAAYLNGIIYRIGGVTYDGTTATVEAYGYGLVASLPQPLLNLMAAAYNGYMYVGGGNYNTKTYRYDPANNVWEDGPVPDLPSSYLSSASGVLNGRWILAGGYDTANSVIGWDPGTGAWQDLTSLPEPLSVVSGATAGSAFYTVGGLSNGGPVPDTLQYDATACPTNTPTVTGTPPTWTPTITNTPTVTPTSTPCYGPNPFQNPGFETGDLPPWVIRDSAATPTVTTAEHHGGTHSALLGILSGWEPTGDSSIYQQVTVPPGGATLSYWFNASNCDACHEEYDAAYVTDLSGNILAVVMYYASLGGYWSPWTYDMSAFAGKTVRIEFLVHLSGYGSSPHMYVDDVALLTPGACPTVTPGGPPSSTPTSSPTNTVFPSPTFTRTPTITPTSTPCYGPNSIQNSGFETGDLPPWVIRDSAATPTVTTAQHHSGNYSAFLGTASGPEPNGDSSIYQQVTVPLGGGTLSFWFFPASCDPCARQGERQAAYITDLNGNIVATVLDTSLEFGGWYHLTYDIGAFAGQTVRIEFLVHESGVGGWTNMYVDDMAILAPGACGSPSPTGTPSPAPASPTSTTPALSTTTVSLTVTPAPPSATPTRAAPTATPPWASPTSTCTVTYTPVPVTPSPTSCSLRFVDVPVGSTFYAFIRCLACMGVIAGYPCGGPGEPCDGRNDPYFKPGNLVTRGQLAKIVSNTAGFGEPVIGQRFEDVAPGSTFYPYVGRLAARGVMGGYPCGASGEPCDPQHRPYFRPGGTATRGQLTKIVSNTAGFASPVPAGQQTFTDVPAGNAFYLYVERLLINRPRVMGGYPCGGPGEPCDPQHRPYFRPDNNITRGQISKVVGNTFSPNCQAEAATWQTHLNSNLPRSGKTGLRS